ncbi:sushi, von Willebrand factor type A, EGF and pentraxin domain-containing protein 1-like [Branchiostoma floridae]|uniref:Sushi, von Willebrand factor type A, EGF and pentraxin domain-containing protein 1-like n=1 Tax=Branchiostoma floridae TaxID=7739 RepID=A0A9J7N7K5_BRAFL|nr:sushi, von Willebrand factor type A, EGF and pentraxin domain-containing protein 1-like [Branchiostoma floridae]
MFGARIVTLVAICLLICSDVTAWRRRRRRRCDWYWNAWSACSTTCGPGTQRRTAGGCGAPGPETRDCNVRCYNGATVLTSSCVCRPGYTDTCCDKRISCWTLHAPSHGTLSGNFYFGDQVTVRCNSGYDIQGSPSRTCRDDGTWSGSEATCTRLSCEPLTAPANGGIRGTTFLYSDVVTFYCNSGYELSGSHSRTCEASRLWSGSPATCSRKACQAPIAPLNGYVSGAGHLYTDTMTFSCAVELGYVLQGPSTSVCQADQTWSNGTPTCQLIMCDQLDPSPNVVTVPDTCTTERSRFKENCVLSCEPGFTSSSEQAVLVTTCGASVLPGSTNGSWTESIDDFKCQDITPPRIVCPSDITADNDPGLDSAEVTWAAPVAMDTTGVTPQVLSSITPPQRFTIGIHTLNYTAIDEEGLAASCDFLVEIRDINEVSSERELSIQWDEPTWTDNSGNISDVFRSNNPGSLFYWGVPQLVYYIARDSAGNKGFCNFTVIVKQHACPYQAPPQNGAIACDTWLGGQFCSVSCNRDFDFAREPESLYYCRQEAEGGTWSPFFPSFHEFIFPWPDCTREYAPGAVVGLQVQYYTSDCAVDTEEVRQNFIEQAQMLNFLAQGFCMDEAECNIDNVQVSCGTPATRETRSAKNIITVDFDAIITWNESSSLNGTSVLSVTAQMDLFVLDIETTLANGGFNISVANLTIPTIPGSFSKVTDTVLTCSRGHVLKDSICWPWQLQNAEVGRCFM